INTFEAAGSQTYTMTATFTSNNWAAIATGILPASPGVISTTTTQTTSQTEVSVTLTSTFTSANTITTTVTSANTVTTTITTVSVLGGSAPTTFGVNAPSSVTNGTAAGHNGQLVHPRTITQHHK